MTLGNMRERGVRGLAVYCLNHACPATNTIIGADDDPDDIEVPSFVRISTAHGCEKTKGGFRAALSSG
jgi:hypothetical protein